MAPVQNDYTLLVGREIFVFYWLRQELFAWPCNILIDPLQFSLNLTPSIVKTSSMHHRATHTKCATKSITNKVWN